MVKNQISTKTEFQLRGSISHPTRRYHCIKAGEIWFLLSTPSHCHLSRTTRQSIPLTSLWSLPFAVDCFICIFHYSPLAPPECRKTTAWNSYERWVNCFACTIITRHKTKEPPSHQQYRTTGPLTGHSFSPRVRTAFVFLDPTVSRNRWNRYAGVVGRRHNATLDLPLSLGWIVPDNEAICLAQKH